MPADVDTIERYAAARDPKAFLHIVQQYQSLVYGTCLRVLGDRASAEDATQECFLRLMRHANAVGSSLAGWLHRCATNVSLDDLKRTRARCRREQSPRRLELLADSERARQVWEEIAPDLDLALEELPEELRYPVVEHFLRQRHQREIADELGVSPATLSRRIDSALEHLRKALTRAGVALPAVALGAMLLDNTAQAAPVSLQAALGKLTLAGMGNAGGAVAGAVATAVRIKLISVVLSGAFMVALSMGLWHWLAPSSSQSSPTASQSVQASAPTPAPPASQPAPLARAIKPMVAPPTMVWRLAPATSSPGYATPPAITLIGHAATTQPVAP